MHNFLLRLKNGINTSKQNKIPVIKIRFSKKCVSVLSILLKKGFIRGFFINNELGNKTICVLLKHIEDNYLLNFEKISLSKRRTYYSDKKLINNLKAFNLSILSTRKGILSSTDCVDLKIGGFFLLNIY
jgi:small subunit ribosomal protein S8